MNHSKDRGMGMKRCFRCERKFPIRLLHTLNYASRAEEGSQLLCPICALEVKSEIHGVKFKKFTGTTAEKLRQEAIKYVNRKPNHDK